jgi:arylsulfate sulfotransferase
MKKAIFSTAVCLLVILGLSACSGGGISPQEATVTPATADLFTSQTVQFSSNVSSNPAKITWAVNGTVGGNSTVGTIDTSGNYTAPSAQPTGTITVSATKVNDSQLTASAMVNVVASGTVSPTANNQVALYTIAPPVAAGVTVQFGTDTTYGLNTWTQQSAGNGTPYGMYVAGMKAKTLYHMRATLQMPDGTTINDTDHTFTTGSLPSNQIPQITVANPNGIMPQSGVQMYDLIFNGQLPAVATSDLQGNVLWYYQPGGTALDIVQPVKPLANGHFLVTVSPLSTDTFDGMQLTPGTVDEVREIDLAGNIVRSISIDTLNSKLAAAGMNYTAITIHHDVAVLPNGHWILIVNSTRVFTTIPSTEGKPITVLGDALVDLDANFNPVWLWDTFDHLDVLREPYMFPDWTHANAVLYSATDGDLLLSLRHQNWIIKIDYNNGAGTGDILWHLGYQGDFTLNGGTDPTDWFAAQHGPSFTTSNTAGQFGLAVFDNGDDRTLANSQTCTTAGITPCPYSNVDVFSIDETAKTATLSHLIPTNTYSYFGGNAETLANNDIEFDQCANLPPGYTTTTFEMTPDSPPEVVLQMTLSGANAYRSYRMPSLYPGVQW